MKHTFYIIIALLPFTISAQNFTRDVDVTVELQPEVRAASRLDMQPAIITKSFNTSRPLTFNSNPVVAPINAIAPLLPPAERDPMYQSSGQKGYLVAGYFPSANFGASAGYRLVDKHNTRLGVMAQLDRNSYKAYMPAAITDNPDKTMLSTTDFTLGANFSHNTKQGLLSAATSLYLAHFNYPAHILEPTSQNVNRLNLNASWQSSLNEKTSGYSISAWLDRFAFGKAAFPHDFGFENELKQNSINELSAHIDMGGRLMFNTSFGIGINIGYTTASLSNRYTYLPGDNMFRATGGISRGVISIVPAFRFNTSSFSGHIGPLVDIATGNYTGTNIGATGSLTWTLSPYLSVYTTAQSGTQLNTLGALYDRNRYAAPLSAAAPSFLQADIRFGFTLGSFRGFSVSVFGGFTDADDYALPALTDGICTFASTQLKSAIYSVTLTYDYGSVFNAKAQVQGAVSNKINHAYYQWNDRARQVVDISLTWKPIASLSLEAGYQLRLGRKICCINSLQPDPERPIITEYSFVDLGRVNAFSIGASYKLSRSTSLFANIGGIGQKDYLQASGLPAQRLQGLVGIAISF